MNLTKKQQTEKLKEQAEALVLERLVDLLTGAEMRGQSRDRESFREMLREGLLNEQEVELEVPLSQERDSSSILRSDFSPVDPDTEKKFSQMFAIMATGGSAKKGVPTQRKRMTVAEAREVMFSIEIDRLLENFDLKKEAISAVEESGIVFIDEIDKICSSRDVPKRGADASDEGVQRDLLPLVEGTTINTKFGNVNTDFILFIASGAFHSVKPSDMLPELQGRLPIRVELQPLSENDLYRILTEPVANLLRQHTALLETEGVKLKFEDDAIREIARIAALVNRTVENIGARRLHTVTERIMEQISFDAPELDGGSELVVDKNFVQERLAEVTKSVDLSRFII